MAQFGLSCFGLGDEVRKHKLTVSASPLHPRPRLSSVPIVRLPRVRGDRDFAGQAFVVSASHPWVGWTGTGPGAMREARADPYHY